MIITRLLLWARVLGSNSFPYQSLLLSTTVFNDNYVHNMYVSTQLHM